MSTPQKNQNNNENSDDFARSKESKHSASFAQTFESSPTENDDTKGSTSTPNIITSVMDEPLYLDFAARKHQELFINKYLNDNIQERDEDQNGSYEKVVQTAISELQAKLKDVGDLTKLPSLQKEIANVVAEIKKKIEMCDAYTNGLYKDHSEVIEYIIKKMENINQVNANTNEIIQKSIDQQLIFDHESQMVDENIHKLHETIDYVSDTNDKLALTLYAANEICKKLAKAHHTKFEKTKKRLKRQIAKKIREDRKSDKALAATNDKVKKCIFEKKKTIEKLDEETIILKNKQTILLAGLNNAKKEYNNLCQKEDDLTKKTAHQEEKIAQMEAANKTLHNYKTAAESTFQQKHSQLSAQLKKITEENAKMQNSMDEKQQQWNNLKRVQENILKKQQDYDELQLKVAALKKQNAESSPKLSTMNDMKLREDQKGMAAISIVKGLSSNTMTDDTEQMDVSDASSNDLTDEEGSEPQSDFDFDSFL